MRTLSILATTGLLAYASAARGETQNYFDNNGDLVGTEMPVGPTARFYYRGDGDYAGSSMDVGNSRFYFDADGNNVGTSMSIGRRRND